MTEDIGRMDTLVDVIEQIVLSKPERVIMVLVTSLVTGSHRTITHHPAVIPISDLYSTQGAASVVLKSKTRELGKLP